MKFWELEKEKIYFSSRLGAGKYYKLNYDNKLLFTYDFKTWMRSDLKADVALETNFVEYNISPYAVTGGKMYFIDKNGFIRECDSMSDIKASYLIDNYNLFNNPEYATHVAKEYNLLRKLDKFAHENNAKADLLSDIDCYYLEYDVYAGKIRVDYTDSFMITPGTVYFNNNVVASDAAELFLNDFRDVYGMVR